MQTRKASATIQYNGVAVTTSLGKYWDTLSYTDPASGEADSLDFTIFDRNNQWITAWLPILGDTIEVSINLTDWDYEGDDRTMDCGFFVLDQFSYSGSPVSATISGVSTPIDGGFSATTKSATWENVTIQEIAKSIAATAAVDLVWDAEDMDFTISALEQSETTDSAFLYDLCTKYGLTMKVYSQKIVIYDREVYKEKDTVKTLDVTDLEKWSWNKATTGTYTGGTFAYTDPTTEEDVTATTGTGTRLLTVSGTADSIADAERQLIAQINDANHSAVTMSVTIMGSADIVASQCVNITGLGKLSGKYFVDTVTHSLGKKYSVSLSMSLVSDMTEEIIEDAITRLQAVGVINTPSYWVEHYGDVLYLDGLILNMATVIKTNLGGTSITTVTDALTVLTAKGVINSPDYWAEKYTAVTYLGELIINAANALTD